jgi:hypothetical protein
MTNQTTTQPNVVTTMNKIGVLRANLYIASNEQLLMNLGDNEPPNNRLYRSWGGVLVLLLLLCHLFVLCICAAATY